MAKKTRAQIIDKIINEVIKEFNKDRWVRDDMMGNLEATIQDKVMDYGIEDWGDIARAIKITFKAERK